MESPTHLKVQTPDLEADLEHFPSRLHSHSSLTKILGGPSTPDLNDFHHEMTDMPNPFDADMQRDIEKQAGKTDKNPDEPPKDPNLVCHVHVKTL